MISKSFCWQAGYAACIDSQSRFENPHYEMWSCDEMTEEARDWFDGYDARDEEESQWLDSNIPCAQDTPLFQNAFGDVCEDYS